MTTTGSVLDTALAPLTVGTLALRHRLVVPPHGGGTGSLVQDDAAFERYCAYWQQRVEDGFQWLGGGPGYVRNLLVPGFEPTGIGASGGLHGIFRHRLYQQRMATFVERVHAGGGYAGVQLVLQGGMPTAPSAHLSGYHDHRATHVLTPAEIDWQVAEYVESGLLALAAGADSIELHANHDDLVQWFLSPLTNRRTDTWGGSFEGRRRFLREIVEGIRSRADRPTTLGLRLAIDEQLPGGYAIDECIRIVQAFEAEGTVDYVSLDVGHNWGTVSYVQPGLYPQAHWAPLAGEVRRETALPVVHVGRIVDPAVAEDVIARGDADAVGMVRALIADPRWLTKARAGRHDEIRPCVGLNDCIHRYTVDRLGFGCGINPAAGREHEPPPVAATTRRQVLVIGGGPGGLEAAAVAAERGHAVRLWEAGDRLGGAMALAATTDADAAFAGWVGWAERRLARLGVDVALGRRADTDAVLADGPDVVVVATGARPRDPMIPGADAAHVVDFVVALDPACPLGAHVALVVEDDGPAPLAVADTLARRGHRVTFVHRTPGPAPLVGKYSAGAWFTRLDDAGVRFVAMSRVAQILPGALVLEHAYSGRMSQLTGVDSVVLACGLTGESALYDDLVGRHPRVHLIGDAFAPRRIDFATRQADELARALD